MLVMMSGVSGRERESCGGDGGEKDKGEKEREGERDEEKTGKRDGEENNTTERLALECNLVRLGVGYRPWIVY